MAIPPEEDPHVLPSVYVMRTALGIGGSDVVVCYWVCLSTGHNRLLGDKETVQCDLVGVGWGG